ncbi:sensor histidine kinase [Mycetocola tolaasinivorans]|uniref:histidine kinase n=1 Tax=Mycetocola tolaasinivorans TaxID=76635 RepID=A0A3L7A3H2_9MICO|nr:HAMP domain-containing sensor histidine kinase [Mycetocola tolaasinivorans]RLP74488.1 sensor histidine kinase [Mycetocola tolaasinivorans]
MSAHNTELPPRPPLPPQRPEGAGAPTGNEGAPAENTSEAPKKKRRRAFTLRQRLLAILLVGIAAASALIGGASVLTVRNLLENRVDEQLVHLSQRPERTLGGFDPQNPGFLGDPGTGPGALGAVILDGEVVRSAALSTDGSPTPLTEAQNQAILRASTHVEPANITIPGLGNYRVMAREIQVLVTPTTLRTGISVTGLPLAATELTLSQLTRAILILAVGVLLIVAAAAYLVVRLALRPLDRVAATAAEVSRLSVGADGDPGTTPGGDRTEAALRVRVPERDADERTEVGRVGASLNLMLTHVEESLQVRRAGEVKLRRFVSDASHELRTPLASIRGYSELARRIGTDLPEDIAYSLSRIGSESIRMTGIVEDLLLLARLDEGRELTRRPVDLTDIVFHAVNDAHAAGPDHPLEFDAPEVPIRVLGDTPRLQQVIVNLLANARVHTPAGTQIRAHLEAKDGEALLEISDNGPGVPEDLRDHVFERFVRGDESRTRAPGSGGTSGLGLSIVAAVVQAHGGRVALESEPGNTVFRITLPLLP